MNDVARLCQALVVRVPDADSVMPDPRLWVEDVPGDAASAVAAQRRERELSRPADPRTGRGLRTVLLRYPDGLADLVVVAHRAVAEDLRGVAQSVLGTSHAVPAADTDLAERMRIELAWLDRVPAPDWGLGTPGSDVVARHDFTRTRGRAVRRAGSGPGAVHR
jgi:hypothetical protein